MQSHQKSSKGRALQSPQQQILPTTQQSEYFPSKNPITSPKFNRKTDFRWSEKKQYPIFSPEHHFVYISPSKSSNSKNEDFVSRGFLSPPSPQAKGPSSVLEDESGFPKKQRFEEKEKWVMDQPCKSVECARKIEENANEIDSLKSAVLKLQKTVRKRNKEIQSKSNEFQAIKSFLIQRQTFISQLQETNTKLNESVLRYEKNSERLLDLYQSLRKEYDREIAQWEKKFKAQTEEISKLNRINKSLTFQLTQKGKTKKSLRKISKENNENMNKGQVKNISNSSIAKKKELRKNKSSKNFHSYDLNTERILQKSQSSIEITIPDRLFTQQNEEAQPFTDKCIFPRDFESQIKKITTLQQKIRYSEIQIDVLKKIKLDSVKIKDDNDKLKFQNRKLLHRIDYLTRHCSRRGNNSDSSLELSLSPTKN